MKYLFCVLISFAFFFLCGLCRAAALEPIPPEFEKAIHQTETSGREGAIPGDNGKALGPLQIHRKYFIDAQEFDSYLKNYSYKDCADLKISKRVMRAYLNRYGQKYIVTRNFEKLAKLHNGGPSFAKFPTTTEEYWQKVKRNLKTK